MPLKMGAQVVGGERVSMFGDLNGPQLLIIIAVVLVVLAAAIATLIVWAVKRSNRARAAELQQAYEAGRNQS